MSAISRIGRLLTGALSHLDKTNPAFFAVNEVRLPTHPRYIFSVH